MGKEYAEIELDGGAVPYRLRRHPRRRRLTLLVDEQGVLEVRAPQRCTRRRVEAFLLTQGPWIVQRLRQARRDRPPLADGLLLPYLDETLTLRLHTGSREGVRREGSLLYLTHRSGAPEERLAELLKNWYRRRARTELAFRLQRRSRALGLPFRRVSVRDQKSRWGSYSSATGTVSLNWRLMLVPEALADYVLVHELAHVRHPNHAPAFWALVARHVPRYELYRDRLRSFRAPFQG